MRNFSLAAIAVILLAGCTQGARIDCTVADAPRSQLVVRALEVNAYTVIDSVKTDASGRMHVNVPLKEGEPEFVYIFYKDTKIASLLLQKGDKVTVTTDTLGHASVEGSPESVALAGTEAAAAAFGARMLATEDPAELASAYISHYRECVRYVLEHPRSLTVVPVLFEQLDAATPVFSQYTDAILFRQAADSLKEQYPQSRYVQVLEKEAARRENALNMQTLIAGAQELGYPDLDMPGSTGTRVRLSEIDSKAVLVHFWNSADALDKMFNLDVLLPLWEKWGGKGLQIYAIDINPDKTVWGMVVKAQKLPWINVNDGMGALQATSLYNVQKLPATFLLVDGELSGSAIGGEDALRKELSRIL